MDEHPGLPSDLVRQATYRRDGLAVFGALDASRAVLLLLNLQNAWLAPDAPFRACQPQERTDWLDRMRRFAQSFRAAGGQVAWVATTTGQPGTADYWSAYYDHFIEPVKRSVATAALASGSAMADWHPSVGQWMRPEDWTIEKYRFSAFARASCVLEPRLRSAGIDTVVVAGTATNICCESTIRDALMRDFKTYMPHDLVACPTADGHQAGLRSVMQAFADVRPSTDPGLVPRA